MLARHLGVLLAAACVVACSTVSAPTGEPERIVTVNLPDLPLPAGVDPNDDTRPYHLGPKDRISISVLGEPSLSMDEVQVGGGGTIDLPVIGVVRAQGLTTQQLALDLETRLRAVLQDPQVSINILTAVSQAAVVQGGISNPGLKPVEGKTTLQEILASSGGGNEFSSLGRVAVLRQIDGKPMMAVYNLKKIRQGVYKDPEVFAGDIITVGESQIKHFMREALYFAPVIYLIDRVQNW